MITGNDIADTAIAISLMAVGSGVILGLIFKAVKKYRQLKERYEYE